MISKRIDTSGEHFKPTLQLLKSELSESIGIGRHFYVR